LEAKQKPLIVGSYLKRTMLIIGLGGDAGCNPRNGIVFLVDDLDSQD
jgi:hypothetical protein